MRLSSAAAAFITFAMLAAAAAILMSHALTPALARLADEHGPIGGSFASPERGAAAAQQHRHIAAARD